MTKHYLEVAKECGAVIHSDGNIFFTNVTKLSAYTARVCAEKDAEIEREKQYSSMLFDQINYLKQELSAANAAIAMKDEALKESVNWIDGEMYKERFRRQILNPALSTSPESIAVWEAEKLFPMQRQVAMLFNMLKDASEEYKKFPHSLGYTITHCKRWDRAIADSQATAEAFVLEIEQRAIERYKLEKQ